MGSWLGEGEVGGGLPRLLWVMLAADRAVGSAQPQGRGLRVLVFMPSLREAGEGGFASASFSPNVIRGPPHALPAGPLLAEQPGPAASRQGWDGDRPPGGPGKGGPREREAAADWLFPDFLPLCFLVRMPRRGGLVWGSQIQQKSSGPSRDTNGAWIC